MFIEIAIVFILTLINGLLSMSELAIVSSREARLKVMAAQGSTGAAHALRLIGHPGRFLSTVQIGITLVGILSGAFSGATLGARLAQWFVEQGLSPAIAETIGVGIVVAAITYLSLIIGELVPKQLALKNAEAIAAFMAPVMGLLSKVCAPLVWLLDVSGRLVLRLMGQASSGKDSMTEEEVRAVIAEAETAGVIDRDERELISGVMRLADRSAKALMTPRREVELIRLGDPYEDTKALLLATHHSRLPVQEGEADEMIGVVRVKDALAAVLGGQQNLRTLVIPAPIVSDTADALDVVEALKTSPARMALVFDEYGHFEGVISPGDILEAITGAFADEKTGEPAFFLREDGSMLVSGWMQMDEFAEKLGLPLDRQADYETVAGFVLDELKHLPALGESFEAKGWRFEVVDLDGKRIDKLLVQKAAGG